MPAKAIATLVSQDTIIGRVYKADSQNQLRDWFDQAAWPFAPSSCISPGLMFSVRPSRAIGIWTEATQITPVCDEAPYSRLYKFPFSWVR
jgi:hypothetical protein